MSNNNIAPASLMKSYRPEVDGLRCLAVCAVIFYHAGFSLFSGGYVGVDVFFVISGYLITGIIYKEVKEQRFSFVNFYERRMRRIFPALFLVLTFTTLGALLWLTPDQLKNYGQSVVAVTVFLSNIYFWLKSGYFNDNSETLPLLHTWSLAVEEQFYIFFPIVLLVLWKLGKQFIGLMLSLCIVASLALCLYLEMQQSQSMNFFWPHTRAWELLVGAMIAIYYPQISAWREQQATASQALSMLGLAMVVATILLLDKHSSFPGVNAVYPVLGTGLIIAFADKNTLVGRLFSLKPIVMIGLLSYSAYLWHQPLFAFARLTVSHGLSVPVYVALIIATFALSYLSWRYVENPFRNKQAVSRKAIFATSFVAMGAFMLAGLSAHVLRGLPQRFSVEHNQLAATAAPSPKRSECHTEGVNYMSPKDACTYSTGELKWAVMGDSHVVEMAYALGEALKPLNQSVKHLSFSGCPAAMSYENSNPGCQQWNKEAVDYISAESSIENVVLIYRHSFYLYGDQLANYPKLPDEHPFLMRQFDKAQARAEYQRSYQATVDALVAAGKRVYLFEPVPELGAPVDRNIFNISWDLTAETDPLGTKEQYYEQRQALVLDMIAKAAQHPQVSVIKPREVLCQQGQCYAIKDNQALYFDDNHLSMVGATSVVNSMLNKL